MHFAICNNKEGIISVIEFKHTHSQTHTHTHIYEREREGGNGIRIA